MKKLFAFTIIIFFLVSCASPSQVEITQTSTEATLGDPTNVSSPTETPEPEETLTICTRVLPESLFPYDGVQTQIKDHLLSLFLEAPYENQGDSLVMNFLEKMPSIANGDIRLEAVTVQGGQTIVDAYGEVIVLKQGVVVRPSGCRGSDCAVEWDGETGLQMDRLVVDYRLREDLAWSDGTPVTAADVLFSYDLANDPDAPGLRWAADRTEQVLAQDPNTYEWVGRPGFTTSNLDQFLWLPLPSHLFDETETWPTIATSDLLAVTPLSYGPFMLVGWDQARMTFAPNPYYYRVDEGLPILDQVTVQVMDGGASAAWEAMKSGTCDVLDDSFGFESKPDLLAEIQSDERFSESIAQGDSWVQLVFGIQPASYDEFYNPIYGDRPDFFGDPRTRQAIASCLDRELMLSTTINGMGNLWPSFLAPDQSRLSSEDVLSYNTALSKQLLTEVGWVDYDNNSQTPLQAWGVPNIPSGTPFSVTLLTDQSGFHQALSEIVQSSLNQCGIEVVITQLPASDLYAPGPSGPLFGRAFDLTLLSWMPMPDVDCRYYMSSLVPNTANNWIGTNITGLMDEGYDAACSTASLSLPAEQEDALQQSELVFLNFHPAVPLFSVPSVMVLLDEICSDGSFSGETFFQALEGLSIEDVCP